MMMNDQTHGDQDRLDLTPLDPRADDLRFERLLREVRCVATPELVRRQAGLTPWGQIARWRRPILAASGVLALASVILLALVHPSVTPQLTLAEAIGVPTQVAGWVQAEERPSPADLLEAEWSER